jgi:tetratricopeptide (TPR) repeat protein
VFALIAIAVALLISSPASAEKQWDENDWKNCYQGEDDDITIAGCTRLIDAHAEYYPEHLFRRAEALARKGDIDRAIADISEIVGPDTNYARPFTARGRLWTVKGEFDRALADFDKALADFDRTVTFGTLRREQSDAYVDRGQVYFYKGAFAAAAADFGRAFDLTVDANAILWRTIARGRLGEDGAAELAIDGARFVTKDWPFPAVAFYRGERSADDMLAAASNEKERCEARFYLDEWQLLHGENAEAKVALRQIVDTCPRDLAATLGAAAELKRLSP